MNIFTKEAFLNIDWKILLIFSGIYLVLFTISEILYHKMKVKVEYTRKFVHLFTGIIALLFPLYIKQPLDLILLCTVFAVLLVLAIKVNILQSVNAIERKSRGSVLYPIIVIICYLFQYYRDTYMYFFIPVLVLAISDPLAAIIGKKRPWKPYNILGDTKTMAGSLSFFVSAFIIGLVAFGMKETGDFSFNFWVALCLAGVTMVGEAISIKGYDNLVIPLCAIAVLLSFGI